MEANRQLGEILSPTELNQVYSVALFYLVAYQRETLGSISAPSHRITDLRGNMRFTSDILAITEGKTNT